MTRRHPCSYVRADRMCPNPGRWLIESDTPPGRYMGDSRAIIVCDDHREYGTKWVTAAAGPARITLLPDAPPEQPALFNT